MSFEEDDELAKAIQYSMESGQKAYVTKPKTPGQYQKPAQSVSRKKSDQPVNSVSRPKPLPPRKSSTSIVSKRSILPRDEEQLPILTTLDDQPSSFDNDDDELARAIEDSLMSKTKREPIDQEYERAIEVSQSSNSSIYDNRQRILTASSTIANSYADLLSALTEEIALKSEGFNVDDPAFIKLNQDIELQMARIEDLRGDIARVVGLPSARPLSPARPKSPLGKSKLPIIKPGTLVDQGDKLVFVEDHPSRPFSPPKSIKSSPKQILVRFHLPNGETEERVLDRNESLMLTVDSLSKHVKERLVIDRSSLGPYKSSIGSVKDVTILGADSTDVYLVPRVSRMRSAF